MPIYQWVTTDERGDRGRFNSVDEAFSQKLSHEQVFVELLATRYRARVLRAGGVRLGEKGQER